MTEIKKNKSQDSSEHQQSVDLVKKFTNLKVKDNIFSTESFRRQQRKVFARILSNLDTGLSRQELLKIMNEEIEDEKAKDELNELSPVLFVEIQLWYTRLELAWSLQGICPWRFIEQDFCS